MNAPAVRPGRRVLLASMAALVFVAAQGAVALAGSVPPNWHIHDGQSGGHHKGIGFFPAILDISEGTYLDDPASCPNATDKAFLPSKDESQSEILRAGVCFTSTKVIQLRTVPYGVSGPSGWDFIYPTDGGYITYYRVTDR